MAGLFQRINFFKGLFMKTEDWQKEQQYHIEKQRFHNKYLHTPGVVPECLQGLKVSVSDTGDKLIVAPGYAIDGEGRDLYVPEPKEIVIPDLQSFNPPTTIYISIRYTENSNDRRENTANPMFSNDALVSEDTIIEITKQKPDNYHNIELAHVRLSEKPSRIHNPDSPPAAPGKAVVPAASRVRARSKKAVVPAATKTGIRPVTKAGAPAVAVDQLMPLDELILTEVPEAGAMTRSRTSGFSLSDLGVKLIDSKVTVIAGNRKQEDTNVLIEQYPKEITPPMYMVFVQSLDGARTRWSIECTENDQGTLDYRLHIRNESIRTTTVMCRIYRVRV
ncbi:MAG: hypothetical protein JSV88_10405 [Candidatus Aminicenantes bacterium]|nr:MAG: hypothetical protein JSV88_10405 [Candidatus Aminicenantes bacterium]